MRDRRRVTADTRRSVTVFLTIAVSSLADVPKSLYCSLHRFSLLWPPCVADADIIFCPVVSSFFLSFFFSSPNFSRRKLDVCHTCTHGGLSANLECRSEMCCTRLAENTGRKKSPSQYRTTLSVHIFATKACIDNRKKTC